MKRIYSMLHPEDYLDEALDCLDAMDEGPEKADETAEALCYADWNDFYYPVLEKYFNEHPCVATGSIGRWDGTYLGGKVIANARDFFDLLRDCYYIELFDENGYLVVDGHHHDGEVLFTVKELTDHGIDWHREHDDGGWHTVNYLSTNFGSKKPQIDWWL